MKAKIGKYLVTAGVSELDGQYVGNASLVWDEADATVHTTFDFWKKHPTIEAAQKHAIEQIEIRVRDGKL